MSSYKLHKKEQQSQRDCRSLGGHSVMHWEESSGELQKLCDKGQQNGEGCSECHLQKVELDPYLLTQATGNNLEKEV